MHDKIMWVCFSEMQTAVCLFTDEILSNWNMLIVNYLSIIHFINFELENKYIDK